VPSLQQYFDGEAVVHRLTPPARCGRSLVDLNIGMFVVFDKVAPVGERAGVVRGNGVEALAFGFREALGALVQAPNH
jgi:hypothetical protein